MTTKGLDADDAERRIAQKEDDLEEQRYELEQMLRAVSETARSAMQEVDEYGIEDEDRLDSLLSDLDNEFRDAQIFRDGIEQTEKQIERLETYTGGDN